MSTTKTRNPHPSLRRRRGRPDDANAFVPDTTGRLEPLPSDDAEAFAEEFIGSATAGESVREDAEDEVVEEEEGGPFLLVDEEGRFREDVPDGELLGKEVQRAAVALGESASPELATEQREEGEEEPPDTVKPGRDVATASAAEGDADLDDGTYDDLDIEDAPDYASTRVPQLPRQTRTRSRRSPSLGR